ncbi:MAG: redoxin domain-containing protein [Phycisphaerae bacterium]
MIRNLNRNSLLATSATFAVAMAATLCAEPSLKVGDAAPKLTIDKWLKGEPVSSLESGKVYVVEFWATWCGPCIAQMPHMTQMQKDFKDKGVTLISVTSEDPRNSLEKAEAMVKAKSDSMGYTVAWDKERETYDAYMQAAERNGIPCCFVVDQKGKIAWIGHPMWLEEVLAPLTAGKWDAKEGPTSITNAEKELNAVFMKARENPSDALAAFEKFESAHPGVAKTFETMKYQLAMAAGDEKKADAIATKLVDRAIADKNEGVLNEIAWTIVAPDSPFENRNLDLALRAAEKADEFTNHNNAPIIDTLARAHFLKGNVTKAIELQRKAIDLVGDEEKSSYQGSLDEYLAAQKES